MGIQNVNNSFFFQANNHVQNIALKNNKRYFKICSAHNLKNLVILIAKVSLSILILPLFSSSYRKWVEKSYQELKNPEVQQQNGVEYQRKLLKKFANNSFLEKEGKKAQLEYKKIKDKVEAVAPGPAFGHVNNVPGSCNLWMPGVAVAANYLSKKTGVKGLQVCQTLEAFQKKFDNLVKSPEDQRCTFILPAFSSRHNLKPNTAQHKVAVCIEKKGNDIRIALLDTQPDENFNPEQCYVENLWEGTYNALELVFRTILKSSFKGLETHLYISSITRQIVHGCAIFALRDGVEFLRDPNFFEKIKLSDQEIPLRGELKMQFIKALPAAFMVGTQSLSYLKKFQEEFPEIAKEKFPEKNKTLYDCIPKNVLKYKTEEKNHYISRKMYKYNNYALETLKNSTDDELKAIFAESLIY